MNIEVKIYPIQHENSELKYRAEVKDAEHIFVLAETVETALGRLILTYPMNFSLQVEVSS